jgi:hypothetical protein
MVSRLNGFTEILQGAKLSNFVSKIIVPYKVWILEYKYSEKQSVESPRKQFERKRILESLNKYEQRKYLR